MADWRFAMVPVRQDKKPQELRQLAKAAKDGKVVQRILGIALILDGRGRSEAASLVGLDPQSLARAVQHYNADGIAGTAIAYDIATVCHAPPAWILPRRKLRRR
jgi:hypothetical protein